MSKKNKRDKTSRHRAEAAVPPPPQPGYWQTVFGPFRRNPGETAVAMGAVAMLAGAILFNRRNARAELPLIGRWSAEDKARLPHAGTAGRGDDIVPPPGESSF